MKRLISIMLVVLSIFTLTAPAFAAKRPIQWHRANIEGQGIGPIAPCIRKSTSEDSAVVHNLSQEYYLEVKFDTGKPRWASAKCHTRDGKTVTGYIHTRWFSFSTKDVLMVALFGSSDIRVDDEGQAVQNLKVYMKKLDLANNINPTFKPALQGAVEHFQGVNGLEVSGFADYKTKMKLIDKAYDRF